MSHVLPRRALALVLAFLGVSAALTLLMLAQLGALPATGAGTRTVRAVLGDAEGLPAQADVLVHGVRVGSVARITVRPGGSTVVRLALTRQAPALHADATVRVGFKTAFGEPFVDLDPGHNPGRAGSALRSVPSVEIDDALAFLDAGGRANLRGVLQSLGAGAAGPETSAEVSGTLAGLDTASASVDRLAGELRVQGGDLRGLVQDGRLTLDALAGRSAQLRALSLDAQDTLAPLRAERVALGRTLELAPAILDRARTTLTRLRPLIARATPLVRETRQAAPDLTAALRQLPSLAASGAQILARAGQLSRSVSPLLAAIDRLAGPAGTALAELGPALADVIPVARYLGPRGNTIAAWFANTADLGSHGDAKGDWARFFINFDPATLTGSSSGAPPANAYTTPGDAAHNHPYASGGYPRLEPYLPALRRRH